MNEAAADARNAVARLSGLISSQQIVMTQRQGAETARFQRLVTIVGAAVLVPGLVAAIFGANVGFRGRESSEAFWAMLLMMIGSGIGSYALIRLLETEFWKEVLGRMPLVKWAGLSPRMQLGTLFGVAGVALVAGLTLLTLSDTVKPVASQGSDSGNLKHAGGRQIDNGSNAVRPYCGRPAVKGAGC